MFPRKESRKIVVDGVAYRWTVSPDSGYLWLLVEHFESPGWRVEAHFEGYDDKPPLTPRVAEAVIRAALAQGWQPKLKSGPALRIDDPSLRG